jgi:hypothetical protein
MICLRQACMPLCEGGHDNRTRGGGIVKNRERSSNMFALKRERWNVLMRAFQIAYRSTLQPRP